MRCIRNKLFIAAITLGLLAAGAWWVAAEPIQKMMNKQEAIAVFEECNASFRARAESIADSLMRFHDTTGRYPFSISEWKEADESVDEFLLPLPNQVRAIEIWVGSLHLEGGPFILVPDPGCALPPPFGDSIDRRALLTDLRHDYFDPTMYEAVMEATMNAIGRND